MNTDSACFLSAKSNSPSAVSVAARDSSVSLPTHSALSVPSLPVPEPPSLNVLAAASTSDPKYHTHRHNPPVDSSIQPQAPPWASASHATETRTNVTSMSDPRERNNYSTSQNTRDKQPNHNSQHVDGYRQSSSAQLSSSASLTEPYSNSQHAHGTNTTLRYGEPHQTQTLPSRWGFDDGRPRINTKGLDGNSSSLPATSPTDEDARLRHLPSPFPPSFQKRPNTTHSWRFSGRDSSLVVPTLYWIQ